MKHPIICAIDPGTTESALIWYDRELKSPIMNYSGIMPNAVLLDILRHGRDHEVCPATAIEWIESFGMAVGKEVFETCALVGRIQEALDHNNIVNVRITRKQVKLHLCQSARATDSNIRQALLDIYGEGMKELAVGTKKAPGPLFGIKSHLWSALAIAVTYSDMLEKTDG